MSYWFSANKARRSWNPATWQGWVVVLAYWTFLVVAFYLIDRYSHSVSDTLISFAPRFLSATALFLLVCWLKGEPLGGRVALKKIGKT